MTRLIPLLLAAPLAALAADKPIQDNSFLVEEAYNQEEGVVQHIFNYTRTRGTGEWLFTFTQEWPVGGIKHQFSYTVPYMRLADSADGKSGVGDVAFNYRYQLLGDGDAKVAIAPRVSVLIPSGKETQGRGAGSTGYQFLVPVSVVLSDSVVAHSNLGFAWTPRAKNAAGDEADLKAWAAGQSVIWLARSNLNFMLEWVYLRGEDVAGPGSVTTVRNSFVNPGVRWSYDFPSGMQIVPGISFPIGVGPSRGEKAFFLYLSIEHPFL